MADDNKPKKDLRARLGRTISPNTPGAPVVPGVTPPPANAGPGSVAPPPGVPLPGAPKNPFAANVASPFAQPTPPADPFGGSGPRHSSAPAQIVLQAIDETPIDETETGRKRRGFALTTALIGAVLGLVAGYIVANVNAENRVFNMSVRHAREVHTRISAAATKVDEARGIVNRLQEALANPIGAEQFALVDQLTAMEMPLPADTIAGRSWGGIPRESVADIFRYYNQVQDIWTQNLRALRVASAQGLRENLATGSTLMRSSPVIAVLPSLNEGRVVASLSWADAPAPGATNLQVRRGLNSPTARAIPLFTAESELGAAGTFAIAVELGDARDIIARNEGLSASAAFGVAVRTTAQALQEATETQGRLQERLGQLSQIQERFSF